MPKPIRDLSTVFSNPYRWFSPWPWVVFSLLSTDQYSKEHLRGTLYRSPGFSLCAALSSPLVCPTNSSHLVLPGLLASSSQFRESSRLHLASPPCTWLGHFLKAVTWDNHRAHLICFPLLRDHCAFLPCVQCLQNHYFLFVWFWILSFFL